MAKVNLLREINYIEHLFKLHDAIHPSGIDDFFGISDICLYDIGEEVWIQVCLMKDGSYLIEIEPQDDKDIEVIKFDYLEYDKVLPAFKETLLKYDMITNEEFDILEDIDSLKSDFDTIKECVELYKAEHYF